MLALMAFLAAIVLAVVAAPGKEDAVEGLTRYVQLILLTLMIANIAAESERALDHACHRPDRMHVVVQLDQPGRVPAAQPGHRIRSTRALYKGVSAQLSTGIRWTAPKSSGSPAGCLESNWFAYTLVAVLPVNLYLFFRFAGPIARLLVLSARHAAEHWHHSVLHALRGDRAGGFRCCIC